MLHLRWLIPLLQILSVSAHPYRAARFENTGGRPRPHYAPQEQQAPPLGSLTWIETTSWPSTVDTAGYWQPTDTVKEISDGQIQAPYQVMTEEVMSTTDWTTVVSLTTITSWKTETPRGNLWTTFDIPSATPSSYDATNSEAPSSSSSSVTSQLQTTTTSESSTGRTTTSTTISSSTTGTQFVTSSMPDTSLTSLTPLQIQTATAAVPRNTTGSVQTSLETSGEPSTVPFRTSLVTIATNSLSLVNTRTLASVKPTATSTVTAINANDIFQPMATDAPPAQISQRADHPVPRLGIQQQQQTLETNKFYANFFLGNQTSPTWTHPYSLSWSAGGGQTKSWGMAISHIERTQLATGDPEPITGAWSFLANPSGIQSIVLSAVELSNGTTVTTDTLEAFSVNVNLTPAGRQSPAVRFPLAQGMGYVTGLYNGATPVIQSGIGFNDVTYVGVLANGLTYKYRTQLADDFIWLFYVTPESSNYAVNSFTLLNPMTIKGPSSFSGYIQVAKVPRESSGADLVYDTSAGVYPTSASISGSVQGTGASYTLTWTKGGAADLKLLMFALPHHVQSFSGNTTPGVTSVQLETTTKGMAVAVSADSWTMVEPDLPIEMGFAPWRPSTGSVQRVSAEARNLINIAGESELSQNITAQTYLDSMYFSGKGLAKFAGVVYALHDIADNVTLALTGLEALENAFAAFVNNEQIYPLVYESAWGGVVSSGSYATGNDGLDFGNTYYNDHHFHFGYFVYAAAVIAYLDPTWLSNGTNKAWVDMLVRDFANPSSDDPYFPFSRSFDWFHGHSWAKGLFESADGKDEESSSEDTMASYGIKMWGQITNDKNMEARGNLMLSLQVRSLQNYFLYLASNTIQPAQFIGNKVSGILFENKIDHITYFGGNIEYVQGIHMIPLMPFSTLTRTQEFVQQEWDTYFATSVDQVAGSWRGILMANLAIIDPETSYSFFSNATGSSNVGLLDGGASETWYLAWSAALGGSLV